MKNAKLTICLPSYNRIEKLKQSLKTLLKQININQPDVRIIILDNFSFEPYENNLKNDSEIQPALNSGMLKIFRNKANIGMSANFLKAFEIVESEWLWIISDDDEILPNAYEITFSKLKSIPNEIGFIKFSLSNIDYLKKFQIINNLYQFIDYNSISKYYFYDFIFISNGLYRVEQFKKLLEIGYKHCHTYIPHFMMITEYIKNKGNILILKEEIIRYKIPEINYSYGLVGGLGVGGIKEINFNLSKNYTKKYYKLFFPYNDYKVMIDLYYLCKQSSLSNYSYYAKNYIKLVQISRNPISIILLSFFWKLGKFPIIFEFLFLVSSKISKTFKIHHDEIMERNSSKK